MIWSHVQNGSVPTTTSSHTATVTLPSNPDPGDLLLVAFVSYDVTGNAPTISDSAGSTYSPIVHQNNTANNSANTTCSIWLYGAMVPANATGSLTITGTGHSSSAGLTVDEFAASGAAAIETATTSTALGGSTGMPIPLSWTAGPLGLDFACFAPSGYAAGNITPSTGFTIASNQPSTGGRPGIITVYKLNDTTGSASPQVTSVGGCYWTGVAVTMIAVPPTTAAWASADHGDAAAFAATATALPPSQAAIALIEAGDAAHWRGGWTAPPGTKHRRPRWVPPIRRPTR